MNDDLQAVSGLAEQRDDYTESEVLGLIGSIIDGYVIRFEYREIAVFSRKDSNTIHLAHPETGVGYGEMKVKGSPLNGVLDWIEAKADLYGEAA